MDFALCTLHTHTPLDVGVENIYYALAIHNLSMDENKDLLLFFMKID
jgi:carbonic anhydrase